MKTMFTIFLLTAGLISALFTASAQIVAVYNSQPVQPGARATGLANATISDAYDASCLYWNPASLAYLKNRSVVLNHYQEKLINGMAENITIPFLYGEREAIGIGFDIDHVGTIGENTYANYNVTQYGYDIAFGKEIFPTFSIGAQVGVKYGHSDVSNLWAVSSSYGIVYSPAPEVTYGAMLTGVGNGIVYASDRVTTSLSSARLPRKLSAGVTLRFPTEYRATILTVSAANEKIFGESGIRYKGGVELYPVEFLAIRGGYFYTDDGAWGQFGFGIHAGILRFDCGFSPSLLTDQATVASLGIRF